MKKKRKETKITNHKNAIIVDKTRLHCEACSYFSPTIFRTLKVFLFLIISEIKF